MTFTGHEDQDIPLATAAEWTANYRNSQPAGVVLAHYFSGDAINTVLKQDGCVGLRIYYANDNAGKPQLIVTGVDSAANDLYNGIILDRSIQCPPTCGAANPLNS